MEKIIKMARPVDKLASFSDSPFVQQKVKRATETLSHVDPNQLRELVARANSVTC